MMLKTCLRCVSLLLLLHAVAAAAEKVPLHTPAGPRPVDGWPVILGNSIRYAPAIADVDGDGRDEVAVGIRDGRVFLLGGDGHPLPGWPQETDSWVFRSPLLDDVDGDGQFEIVAMTFDGFIYQWRVDGSPVPGWPLDLRAAPVSSPQLIRVGPGAERRILAAAGTDRIFLLLPDGSNHPGWPKTVADTTALSIDDMHPTAHADLDGDRSAEILHLSSRNAVLRAWRSDGSDYPGFPRSIGEDMGLGLALDDEVRPSLIACTTLSHLFVFDTQGKLLYTRDPLDDGDRFAASPYFISSGDSSHPAMDRIFAGSKQGAMYLWDREGRLLPGWPVRLGGFIYGVYGKKTADAVYGPPLTVDADGDGALELIVGSFNHHLYCLEFDGRLVPGWPETVEDAIIGAMAFAQLDGSGGKELVVGQIGETMFAFHLGPPPEARIDVAPPGRKLRGSTEWAPEYSVVAAIIALMALLLVRHLRVEYARAGVGGADGWTRATLFILFSVLVVRVGYYVDDIRRYKEAGDRMAAVEPVARGILDDERRDVRRMADELAADLDSSIANESKTPLGLLPHLERLADHYRFDYRFKGLLAADAAGDPIVGIGLARGWSDLDVLGIGAGGAAGPILLEETPVFVQESSRGIGSGPDSLRLFLFSSLLATVPDEIADATGFSAYLRLEDRTLAWGGAALSLTPGVRPRADRTQPSRDISILDAPGEPRLSIRLAMENFDRPFTEGMAVVIVLLAPFLYLFLSVRRIAFERVRMSWWWIPLFVAAYAAGIVVFRSGVAEARHVSLAARSLETILHAAGMLGLVVAARNIAHSGTSKRLDVALLGSYLLVGLIPIAVIITFMAAFIHDSQYRHVQGAIDDLTDRADNLAISYTGRYNFLRMLDDTGLRLFGRPPETGWLNFVEENHQLFTYDLPTSFLTLWAYDRSDPDRYYTGFSYRAPRKDKLYSTTPAWMGGENQKGLFLDNGTPVIRALRAVRTRSVEARICGHIPLDEETLGSIEKQLHIVPFLPYVRLEPSWPESTRGRSLRPGWRLLHFSSDVILRARDWNTGAPRWIAYRVHIYLPPGRERWFYVVPLFLLLLLPLGLSVWGAYSTFQRTVQPLRRLLGGIRRVEQGDMEFRLMDTGESEIALAAQSFDKMAESLEGKIGELAEKRKVEEISRLKSHFISMVSHDLKTPLASIKGAAENILEELAGPVSDRQRTYLEMILKSSDNLQQMISNILDLSRIESGHMSLNVEVLDVKRETEHILRFIRPLLEEKNLKARIVVEAKDTAIAADRTRLWQIINNVMSNAIRYSPRGGLIDILVEDSRGGDAAPNPMLTVTITDEGPGVAEDDRERIFEPFYTRSSEAAGAHRAGLGLTIVKQLVELHGGAVSVTNSAQGGASFTLTLPAKKSE
jgi:signal transduction histidine kinase